LGYLFIILFLGKHFECSKSKLSSACYAMRSVKPYVSLNTQKVMYYSCFHSVVTYSLLFWGNSSKSIKNFKLNKNNNDGFWNSDACRKLFFNLEILLLPFQYILSLLLFMIRNRNQFLVNSEVYHTDTRQHANFQQPSVNLTKYQKGVYCLDV
jgi:hypothetical protein